MITIEQFRQRNGAHFNRYYDLLWRLDREVKGKVTGSMFGRIDESHPVFQLVNQLFEDSFLYSYGLGPDEQLDLIEAVVMRELAKRKGNREGQFLSDLRIKEIYLDWAGNDARRTLMRGVFDYQQPELRDHDPEPLDTSEENFQGVPEFIRERVAHLGNDELEVIPVITLQLAREEHHRVMSRLIAEKADRSTI